MEAGIICRGGEWFRFLFITMRSKEAAVAGSVDFVFRVLNGREDVLRKVLNTSSSIFEKKVYHIS